MWERFSSQRWLWLREESNCSCLAAASLCEVGENGQLTVEILADYRIEHPHPNRARH